MKWKKKYMNHAFPLSPISSTCHAKVIINSNDWYYHRNIFGMLVHFPFIEQLSQAERKTIVEIDKAYCFATSCENETKMLSKYLLIYYFFFLFRTSFFLHWTLLRLLTNRRGIFIIQWKIFTTTQCDGLNLVFSSYCN